MSNYLTNLLASSKLLQDSSSFIQEDIERQRHLYRFSGSKMSELQQVVIGQIVHGHLLERDIAEDRRLYLKLLNENHAKLVVDNIIAAARKLVGDNLVIENADEVPHYYADFYDQMLFGEHAKLFPSLDEAILAEQETPQNFEGKGFIDVCGYLSGGADYRTPILYLTTGCGKWIKKDPPDELLYRSIFNSFGIPEDEPAEPPRDVTPEAIQLLTNMVAHLNERLRAPMVAGKHFSQDDFETLKAKLRSMLD